MKVIKSILWYLPQNLIFKWTSTIFSLAAFDFQNNEIEKFLLEKLQIKIHFISTDFC